MPSLTGPRRATTAFRAAFCANSATKPSTKPSSSSLIASLNKQQDKVQILHCPLSYVMVKGYKTLKLTKSSHNLSPTGTLWNLDRHQPFLIIRNLIQYLQVTRTDDEAAQLNNSYIFKQNPRTQIYSVLSNI